MSTIAETYGLEVIEPAIPKSIRFAEAPAAGRSIRRATRPNRGAPAYREVARRLSARVAAQNRAAASS